MSSQVMLSSDKISEIRQPVLSLSLKIGATSTSAQNIEVEMTKSEIDKMLRSMESAMKVSAVRSSLC